MADLATQVEVSSVLTSTIDIVVDAENKSIVDDLMTELEHVLKEKQNVARAMEELQEQQAKYKEEATALRDQLVLDYRSMLGQLDDARRQLVTFSDAPPPPPPPPPSVSSTVLQPSFPPPPSYTALATPKVAPLPPLPPPPDLKFRKLMLAPHTNPGRIVQKVLSYFDAIDIMNLLNSSIFYGRLVHWVFEEVSSPPPLIDIVMPSPPSFLSPSNPSSYSSPFPPGVQPPPPPPYTPPAHMTGKGSNLVVPSNTPEQLLTMFYEQHNPEKLSMVKETLAQYKGNEHNLFQTLAAKYETEDPYERQHGGGGGGGGGTAAVNSANRMKRAEKLSKSMSRRELKQMTTLATRCKSLEKQVMILTNEKDDLSSQQESWSNVKTFLLEKIQTLETKVDRLQSQTDNDQQIITFLDESVEKKERERSEWMVERDAYETEKLKKEYLLTEAKERELALKSQKKVLVQEVKRMRKEMRKERSESTGSVQ